MGDVKDPIKPNDLVGTGNGDPIGDPITMSLFKTATKQSDTEFVPKSASKHYSFDPHAPQFEYIPNATPATTNTDYFNSLRQTNLTKAWRGLKQFGANVASSFGQGLANTFDMFSLGKTVRGEITGSDDNFSSSLFGISTKDMQDWANGVAERNKIWTANPGAFDPSSFGWWANQFAQAGTGVGMALEAISTTLLVEAATGGTGTGAVASKFANLFNKAKRTEQGLNILQAGFDVAKGMKSAATVYGVVNRYSESRMEAMQSYDDIYNELSNIKTDDGHEKFTEEEKRYLASEGARRTFNLNLALLPLDIMAYRTMMYNPISGSGTGLLERGLDKIGNKFVRKAVQGLTFAGLEGGEEGFQYVGSEEGKHYAKVLGGMDDGSTFIQRFGKDIKSDEFWNNFAGGVIGSPIIMGANHLINKAMTGNRSARLNSIHEDYISNIAKMDNGIAEKIKEYQEQGKTKEADILRRQFRANKALSALHLDAMTDKNTAFDSHVNFLESTLEDVNEGKLDALVDLGFANPSQEQVDYIKKNFQDSIDDANEMKFIYDNVKQRYNKNFVPEITQSYFQLNRLVNAKTEVEQRVNDLQGKLYQFGQLSTNGKTQYNSEYELQTLQLEQKRLSDQFRTTEDEYEKKNIEQLIDSNKAKIVAVREKLEEIAKDDTYTEQQKKTDNDILNSALRDRDYAQAMYEREHLDNAIALQRKNISLWNDKKYIAKKTQESISKAKTKQQVEDTEEELNATGTNTDETKIAIQEKKNEIATNEAAVLVNQQKQEQENANGFTGNANLFADDSNLIETIKHETNINSVINDENQKPDEAEFLFSPNVYDFDKSSDESKNRVINGVRGLADKLGGDLSFESLVRHVIKVQGEGVADSIFNALKWGWEKAGFKAEDYDAVYSKVFGNPMDELIQGASQLIQTEEQLETATTGVTDKVKSKENNQPEFDNNNQPVYTYEGIVTNESSPKLAFSTRLSQLVQTFNEDGSIAVSHEYTEDELNMGDYVDSLQLLDPDKYDEGTEMVIKVPLNFMDIKIPIYNSDGTKGQSMSFGQYVAQNNLTPVMKEYRDKIPMIIYKKGANPNEKGLAFVHDIGWYHPLRFNQNKKDDMANAIANTREIRDAVLADEKNSTEVIITGKRQTTFAGLKTKPDETVTLREANPETQLTVALTTDSLSTSSKNTVFPNNQTALVNNSPFRVGQVLDVRRYGKKNGVKTYLALPVLRPKLDDISKSSVLQAINIYANRTNQNPTVRERHDKIIKEIQEKMGLDILNSQGLEKYLHHFISTFNTEKAKTNEDVESQARAKLKPGTPYISFIAGGNIVFGITDEAAYVANGGVKKYSYFINPNSATPSIAISNLNKDRMIGWYEQNLNLDNLNRNKPVVTIGKDLSTTVSAPTYNDFLLDRYRTNIRSYNIGTEDKPNYVTNVQPVITYDLKSKFQQGLQTNQEVKKEIEEKAKEGEKRIEKAVEESSENLSDIEKQIIEQAKKDLGSDFGISKDDTLLLNPTVLSEQQRADIAANINRIAGLTPDQQFDITDFMYNQITTMVNLDSKVVTRAEVDRQVTQAFNDIVLTLKKTYEDKIKELNQLLETHPALKSSSIPDVINDYQYRVDKIDAIENSLDTLKEEAYNRVAKYTGITENKVATESLNEEMPSNENPDIKIEDIGNEREADFWTDVLQENPENKLSYSMRRFFGQIRKYDKNGKLVNGFLGLPSYTGADTVIRTLMVTLADTPSDFDTMIAKLESRKAGIYWMQEVIDKLKGASQQKKNQFVTVMSNTSLRMKFTMISFNRKTNSWTTKVYDTNLNGVANSVKEEWRNNFFDSDLAIAGDEGNYQLNKKKAQSLIQKFESWKGVSLKEVEGDISAWRTIVDTVKKDRPATLEPTGAIAQWLKTNVVKNSDRVKFSLKGYDYQVRKLGDNKYQISFLEQNSGSKEEVNSWLREFGITLSPGTLDELMTKGLFHNYRQNKPNDLFTTDNGLFQILYNKLKILVEKEEHDFTEYGDSPLDESVINSLANLESKYNDTNTPFGFRDNGKSFFALTAPKFITDRVRDLKTVDSVVRNQLSSISFSRGSMWLNLLSDIKFRDKFNVSHIGANAFKELGKRLYKDNGITKLSDLDHELTKLGMFWDMTQGEVRYSTQNAEGKEISLTTYPDTSIGLRMGTMFSPTMSDKHMMTLVTTAVLNLENKDLQDGKGISDELAKIIYEQTVKPELMRMIKFHQNGGSTNILAYDKGAGMFLLMPDMNNIEYSPGLRLIDAIRFRPADFTQTFIEGNNDLMDAFYSKIKNYVNALTQEKVLIWEKNGIIVRGETSDKTTIRFFDKKYIDKFRGDNNEKAQMAAMDFVVNSLISNANSFMMIAGDPAMYFKSKSNDPITIAKDTFINAGKRLANQIAPGTTLSNSENEKYIQVFLEDRVSSAENIDYLTRLLGEEEAKAYTKIEGSDAQEYTTWKEHLDILAKLGKTGDNLLDITPEEISEARELFSSNITKSKLTERQSQLLDKVMQPIKPVYTGQIYDAAQDAMRTVYIKSSSFPLIPQLTAGMEIDKLRVAMENLEKSHKMNVRASYQTANKTGAITNPVKLWDEQGNIDEEALKTISDSTLVLDRKNFRIQQEVPFKSIKTGEDRITLGTQLMKLLFGDEVMKYDGFTYNGKEYNGIELHKIYNDTFINLVQEKRNQLFSELGLDEQGQPVDVQKSMSKLQSILKDEAVKRGYPLQDIQGLTLNKDGEFNLPLWASSNSNRYESMLNSIITNRLIRMKFPGNSFVVGSEEGFRVQDNLEGIDKSKIIFTSSWNGKYLQGSKKEDGTLKSAQVLVASKFKDSEGNLVDLFTKENGEYKYIIQTEQGFRLNESMIDKELLKKVSFRIPTSGHQSASEIEIVGFLPFESADLMIVPRGFTKQKGLDFDIDKENAYQLWTYMNEDGKFEALKEEHRAALLAKADKYFNRQYNEDSPEAVLMRAIFGDNPMFTEEDIKENKHLNRLNSAITEKLMQNELIRINHAVFTNPHKDIQSKINKTLHTDFAEAQASFIDDLVNIDKDSSTWTPLSDEYQKQKMMMGASGKIGTGAYSLDVVFHSLVQQASMIGKPIQLIEIIDDGEETKAIAKVWKFGNIESDGKLGSVRTLDGGRSIAEVMSERQNIAVDNEKLQVMGRVNLNDITMDVDKVMNLLGFDKGSDGNSISFLFLSQPIIREFVERMKNANSNMAEFDPDKEGTIFNDLIKKYNPEGQEEINDEYWKKMSRLMTNENFISEIRKDKPDGSFQSAVLRRFMEMKQYGIALRGIQTTINTDSKGLGKSFFDVIEKRNSLNRIGMDTSMITGASGLIGDYVPKIGSGLSTEEVADLIKSGYVDIGNFYVKPETLSGGFNIHGVATAYNLWSRYFPYDASVTQKAFTEILSIIGSDTMGDTRTIEYKQDIFRNVKKYFAASKLNGIISEADDINKERERIFIDSDSNTSLAKYIKSLKQMNGNAVVDTFIKTNKLINRFEFEINKNGEPSLIKFNNAAGEEFDEQYLYESLATLMEVRGKTGSIELPQIGNKKYTLDTLAQDLIAYSYLGNAIQEAIQFTKYVPVSYLNTVGFSQRMRAANLWLKDNPNVLGVKLGNKETEAHLVSEFTMQYIQHHPEKVKYKMDDKSFKARTIRIDDNSFLLKGEDKPTFVSVYDPSIPKGEKKFRLYWFDGEKYTKIPVLGTFGMDEYQPRNSIGTSLVNGRVKVKADPQGIIQSEAHSNDNSFFSINSKDLNKVVKSISEGSTVEAALAKELLPFISDIKIDIVSTTQFDGAYNKRTREILINDIVITDEKRLANTVIHEVVHGLTVDHIGKYITVDENDNVSVNNDAPIYVSNLVRVFNTVKKQENQERLQKAIEDFRKTGTLNKFDYDDLYGLFDIYEFVAMALTNKMFQKQLNDITYKNTNQTILERFKKIIKDILSAIGVNFDENSAATATFNSIFELIEAANKPKANPYDQLHDDAFNTDSSFLDRIDDELEGGEPEVQFLPSTKEGLLDAAKEAVLFNVPKYLQQHYLDDIETGLKEIASQLNSTNREQVEQVFGKNLVDIAIKLFPNERYNDQSVEDYISKLNDNQKQCD